MSNAEFNEERFQEELKSEQDSSPFTCAVCGKVAMWKKLLESGRLIAAEQPFDTSRGVVLSADGGAPAWWLEVPCECGSQQFRCKTDTAKWVGSYGTNG